MASHPLDSEAKQLEAGVCRAVVATATATNAAARAAAAVAADHASTRVAAGTRTQLGRNPSHKRKLAVMARAAAAGTVDEKLSANADAIALVDAMAPRYSTKVTERMVLRAVLYGWRRCLKRGESATANMASIVKIAQDITGMSHSFVTRVWTDFTAGILCDDPPRVARRVRSASATGASKRRRIRDSQEVVDLVRGFVRQRRDEHREADAADVTRLLIEHNELGDVDLESDTAWNAAYRCVCHWLDDHGWVRGKEASEAQLAETAKQRAARASYLAVVTANRADGGERLREVFTGESYIHQHCRSDASMLHSPKDAAGAMANQRKSNGDRLTVVGCMLGPDLTKKPGDREDTFADKGGWYQPAYEKFRAPRSRNRKKEWHAEWYERWFEAVAMALQRDGHKCLFILDDVAYHKATHFHLLKAMKEADLFAALRSAEALQPGQVSTFASFQSKAALVPYLDALEPLTQSRVQAIAARYGHKVAYTPPYHRDLQPIEAVWAMVQRQVTQQHRGAATMPEVLASFDAAFARLTPASVYDCYTSALKREVLAQQLVDADEVDDT